MQRGAWSSTQHFWLTNCPTNRMRWVEPSVGGLLSYNQSPSVGLSLCLCTTVASGKRKMRNGEGGKKGCKGGLVAHRKPLTLGLNRQTQKEWARDTEAESHLQVFYVSSSFRGNSLAISTNVNTTFIDNIIKLWQSQDDVVSFPVLSVWQQGERANKMYLVCLIRTHTEIQKQQFVV